MPALQKRLYSAALTDMRQPRVGIVATHPIQHFCPLYRAIASTGAIDLKIFFASDAGAIAFFDAGFGQEVRFQDDLLAGFDYEFLPGHVPAIKGRIRNPNLRGRLSAFSPDAVHVYGYYHPLSHDAMSWARAEGRRVLFCSDSELRFPRKPWTKAMKALVLPGILARCDGFLTTGDCNEDYFRAYGVSPDRLFRCPFPVDEPKLNQALGARVEVRRALRAKFALPADATLALVVGKLTAGKAVSHAIEAVAKTWSEGLRDKLFLVIAGNGAERENLQALARSLQPEAVQFAGFVEVTELPNYYCAADLLIHPSSQDAHPLAISEAIFCGLPVVTTDRVGSVGPTDDVRPGVNGIEYPYGDVDSLGRHLHYLCDRPDQREEMGRRSFEIARKRGMDVSVAGYLKAVHTILGHRSSLNPS
jgi:glycosyltransferase involved in cell wall biosynthesis